MICLFFASDDVIPGTHNQTAYWLLTIDRAKTHRHKDKRRNRFLKHNFLLNLTKTQKKQAHPDMTSHTTMISEEQLY